MTSLAVALDASQKALWAFCAFWEADYPFKTGSQPAEGNATMQSASSTFPLGLSTQDNPRLSTLLTINVFAMANTFPSPCPATRKSTGISQRSLQTALIATCATFFDMQHSYRGRPHVKEWCPSESDSHIDLSISNRETAGIFEWQKKSVRHGEHFSIPKNYSLDQEQEDDLITRRQRQRYEKGCLLRIHSKMCSPWRTHSCTRFRQATIFTSRGALKEVWLTNRASINKVTDNLKVFAMANTTGATI